MDELLFCSYVLVVVAVTCRWFWECRLFALLWLSRRGFTSIDLHYSSDTHEPTRAQRIPTVETAASAGTPLQEPLFVLSVLTAVRRRLIGAGDPISDSAPVLDIPFHIIK